MTRLKEESLEKPGCDLLKYREIYALQFSDSVCDVWRGGIPVGPKDVATRRCGGVGAGNEMGWQLAVWMMLMMTTGCQVRAIGIRSRNGQELGRA